MLTDITAERFIKKLGEERYNERISIVEKYRRQWELSEIEFQQSLSINSLIFMRFQNDTVRLFSKFVLTMVMIMKYWH